MELRTRTMWASALLAAAVMALAPGRALAQGMEPGALKRITDGSAGVQITDPGELKARMESFASEMPKSELEPGQWKRIAEAPARFAVVDPGELKALMESGVRPIASADGARVTSSEGFVWTGVGAAALLILFSIGAAVMYGHRRRDHTAPA